MLKLTFKAFIKCFNAAYVSESINMWSLMICNPTELYKQYTYVHILYYCDSFTMSTTCACIFEWCMYN